MLRELGTGLKTLYLETRDVLPARSTLRSAPGAGRTLSWRELNAVKRNNADLKALIPFLILFNAPGGMVLLPALAKLVPSFLPSTFVTQDKMPALLQARAEIRARSAKAIAAYYRSTLRSRSSLAIDDVRSLVFAAQTGGFDHPRQIAASLGDLPEDARELLAFDALPDAIFVNAVQFAGVSSLKTRLYSRARLNNELLHAYAHLELEDILLADTMLDDTDDIAPLNLAELRQICDGRAIPLSYLDNHEKLLKSLVSWLELTPGLYDCNPDPDHPSPNNTHDEKHIPAPSPGSKLPIRTRLSEDRIHAYLYGPDESKPIHIPDSPHLILAFQVLSTINAAAQSIKNKPI